MPSYVSHTIMAKDVYKRIDNKKVDYNYMITFSLGGDLCKYAKCRYDSHHKNQTLFLYNMCDYMKENNLVNDKECLGVLYGHICHLAMDEEMHPLIRKVDKICSKNKKNHTLIELYYDNYLVKKNYNINLNKYDNNKIFKGKVNKKISKMLDSVYEKTYNTKNVSLYYKLNLSLYKKIKYIYKIATFNFLKKVSGINNFLKENKEIDLLNDKNNIKYRDVRNKECSDNIFESYDKSVKRAVKDIERINKYLYE